MNHNYKLKGILRSSPAMRIGWLSLMAMLGCVLLYSASAQNTNRNQKVPPQQRKIEEPRKTTGVENNAMANMMERRILNERIDNIAQNIHQQLDGHVVGYSFVVGDSIYQKADGYGQARTSADGAQRDSSRQPKLRWPASAKW